MKVMVRAPFDTMSGYGNDGCGLAAALTEAGHDVHLWPEHVTPPIPPEIAELLLKYPDPPFDLGIVHVNPTALGPSALPLRYVSSRLVAWSMYEYERFRWPGWEEVRPALEEARFDRLLCYDETTQRSLGDDPAVNPGIPTALLQGGYDPRFWVEVRPNLRDWSGTFRYVMAGRLDRRKGAWSAVRAFGQLKDRYGDAFDAELHLKTTIPGQLPPQLGDRWPGIFVHLEWWPHERLRNLYARAHCYLAPSTGEGKNLPALEAQTTGIPAIATDYGGHRGWLSPEWGYPLRYELHEYPEGPAAAPDEEHLTELMWHVYTNREEARRKGELAARTLPPMLGWDAVVSRLMTIVADIEPSETFEGTERSRVVAT